MSLGNQMRDAILHADFGSSIRLHAFVNFYHCSGTIVLTSLFERKKRENKDRRKKESRRLIEKEAVTVGNLKTKL